MIQPVWRSGRIGRVSVGVTALTVAGALAACGADEQPSAERFCGEIEANLAQLTSPRLDFVEDVEPVLELYRDIADLAPLTIEEEWRQLVTNYETASTVVPDDPDSVQRVVTMAYRSERSAARVEQWLQDNCALSMGPIATIVPQDG